MKLPLRWLESYVPVTLPPRELAERLTMSGSLVEQVANSGSRFDDILVAAVIKLEPHPNADTLWLATLDLGDRTQTVVTGAQNLFVGAIVPFIGVGKRLPGQDKPLEGKMLRGIRSEGMVCSGRELGLSDNHDGIMILDESILGPGEAKRWIGAPLSQFLGEWVLDLDITPNRPDCLSIFGLAREVAAVTGAELRPLSQLIPILSPEHPRTATLAIDDPDLCRRISATIISGITVGESPKWLVERLEAAGVRSINNVVDVTNYVMLELGQPLHAYDIATLAGPTLRARRARAGERITTLDGAQRNLSTDMLLIADDVRAVGIAGVMGGAETEVSANTSTILLEAATFNGRNIRRTSVALGLRSEASARFEKGLPLQLAAIAARRAAALIAELGGGEVTSDVLWAGEPDPEPLTIMFPLSEVERLLGVQWTTEHILGNLKALGFETGPVADGVVPVTLPWWREDLFEPADVVEEVARVTGFDAIPETLLQGSVPPRPESDGLTLHPRVRAILLGSGLNEGSSPALTSMRALDMLRLEGSAEPWLAAAVPNVAVVADAGSTFMPVKVVNPLTPDREVLRPMLLPGLLEALRDNLRAGEERAAFFEIDNCVLGCNGTLPVERRDLAIAISGSREATSWAATSVALDFFDLKGIIETLLIRLGIDGWAIAQQSHPLLHPGRAASVVVHGTSLGFLGELHPSIAQRWDLASRRAYVAELDFDALAALASGSRTFADFARQPVAKRDLAVVVDHARPATIILDEIRRAAKGLLAKVTLFDVYEGEQLPEGKKSLAIALGFQSEDRTLADDEIEKAMSRIRKALEHKVGATFRA